MAKLTRSVTINVPVDTVFDFAMDIARFWSVFPEVAVRDVQLRPDGVGSSARIYTHDLGLHFEGVVEFTEVVRNQRILAKVTFGPETPIWTFTFEPVDGGTTFTAEGEWHVNIPAVGGPLEGMIAKSHKKWLEGGLDSLKAALEAGAA